MPDCAFTHESLHLSLAVEHYTLKPTVVVLHQALEKVKCSVTLISVMVLGILANVPKMLTVADVASVAK